MVTATQLSLNIRNTPPIAKGESVVIYGVLESASFPYFDINNAVLDLIIKIGDKVAVNTTVQTYQSFTPGENFQYVWQVPSVIEGMDTAGKQVTLIAQFAGDGEFSAVLSSSTFMIASTGTTPTQPPVSSGGYSVDAELIGNPWSAIRFKSCAPQAGGYFYVLKPSGGQLGKVDIPKGACRSDDIARQYFNEAGNYKLLVADYNNITKVSKVLTIPSATTPNQPPILPPVTGGTGGGQPPPPPPPPPPSAPQDQTLLIAGALAAVAITYAIMKRRR